MAADTPFAAITGGSAVAEQVADFVLKRLRQWGIEHVYAYPGDGINGLVAAFGRADDKPQFIQTRHEEMAAFAATGYAKFSGRVGVCMATSGPGAIHLLNGLYDAKLDHVPVVAIVGQTARSAVGGAYQQEVDLKSLYKDVASDYLVEVNVAAQLPNALDRAIRTAMTRRAPTAIIIPSDVQEEPYEAPGHEFKQVPSSPPNDSAPVLIADETAVRGAADIINAGERVAILIGQGARTAAAQVQRVADITGAGVAKALLGKDVLSDDLPYVTGAIGLLGTRPSYELMRDCDTLLIVGSNFPYSQFLPKYGAARAVQVDIDGSAIGMRYPTELNIVADAASALDTLIPLLKEKHDRSWRTTVENNVSDWWETLERQSMLSAKPANPMRIVWELSQRLPQQRHRHRRLRIVDQLVCQVPSVHRRRPWFGIGHVSHDGVRRSLRNRCQVRPPRPAGDCAGRRWRDADERHGRVADHQTLQPTVEGPPIDRLRIPQQRSQPGHLGTARDGRCAQIRTLAITSGCVIR